MKKTVKKVSEKTKNAASKTSKKENDFVTNKKFDAAIKRLDQKIDEKTDKLTNEIKRLDQKIEQQTDTILSAVESIHDLFYKAEIKNEEKDNYNRAYFADGLSDKDLKIKNLEKRVEKLESKVL